MDAVDATARVAEVAAGAAAAVVAAAYKASQRPLARPRTMKTSEATNWYCLRYWRVTSVHSLLTSPETRSSMKKPTFWNSIYLWFRNIIIIFDVIKNFNRWYLSLKSCLKQHFSASNIFYVIVRIIISFQALVEFISALIYTNKYSVIFALFPYMLRCLCVMQN